MDYAASSVKPAAGRGRWWIHLILIAGYILVVGLLGLGRRNSPPIAALSQTAAGLLARCALELLVFGLIFGLACWVSRATRDDLLLRWRGSVQPVLWGVGYSVALRLAFALLLMVIGVGLVAARVMSLDQLNNFFSANRPSVERLIDVSALRHDRAYFWLTLTVVSFVVAGLREELWRAAFLAALKALWPWRLGSRAGQVGAVLICAVIFGLGHVTMGWLAVCLAGLLGVGLGLIMVLHRSIWPAVIAHGMFDATSFALLPWAMAHITRVPA